MSQAHNATAFHFLTSNRFLPSVASAGSAFLILELAAAGAGGSVISTSAMVLACIVTGQLCDSLRVSEMMSMVLRRSLDSCCDQQLVEKAEEGAEAVWEIGELDYGVKWKRCCHCEVKVES